MNKDTGERAWGKYRDVNSSFCVAGTQSAWGYLMRVNDNLGPPEERLYKSIVLHFTTGDKRRSRISEQKSDIIDWSRVWGRFLCQHTKNDQLV